MDLVLIDALVRDRKGHPIPGLGIEDFELRVDDRPAEISTFENYCANPVIREDEERKESGQAPQVSAGEAERAPAHHIVLFFDINQLTEKGRDRAIDASVEFVREKKASRDQVMIIVMKKYPRLLEGFTSDSDRLMARLSAMRADPEMLDRHYLEEHLNMNDILSRQCTDPGCYRRRSVAVPYAEEEMLRTKRSLDAVRNLMPALGAIQGRKTLVHFSESLRDEPGIQYLALAMTSPGAQGIDIRFNVTELQREANAAGVSLYMVWAAGLGEKGSLGMGDASRSGNAADTILLEQGLINGEDSAIALGATLSLETGGVATKRTNDLGLAFDAVQRDLSCYYVLGYVNKGPGDGRRHMLKVRVGTKGLSVRHRPYYEDSSESDRLDRLFRSALMAPDYFDKIPVTAEAYALAPDGRGTPILLKAEFPASALTLVRQPDGVFYGEAEIRTTVWKEGAEACEFARRVSVTSGPEEEASHSVIYEAGCELPAGEHEFAVAVLDSGSWEMGAASSTLPIPARAPGLLGDVVLWTSSGQDHLEAEDASVVGIQTSGSGHGFVPRIERRFWTRESGVLYSVICLPEAKSQIPAEGVRVSRRLLAGEMEVASFPDLTLGSAEDAEAGSAGSGTGCVGIFSPIPAGQLGTGGYIFETRIEGIPSSPIVHKAGIAVSDASATPSP